jgi:ankyrin repeat protein
MAAAAKGHLEIVRLLGDRGADIRAKDNHKFTALVWASQEGHRDVVELLKALRDRPSDPV